jgi:hypothetical protein
MSQSTLPTFLDFLSSLQERSSTPDDWVCGICMEPTPNDNRTLEVTECPVALPCGHIFDVGCLYTWLNGEQVREEMKSNDTCPLCRTRLYQGYTPDEFLTEMVSNHLRLYPEFFDRAWDNRTASSWLTGWLQECLDSPDGEGNRGASRDWKLTVSHLAHAATGPDAGFIGRVATCDAGIMPFLCDGHQQHGHLWLELFLALRIFREAFDENWHRTKVFMEFERWFVQIAEQYKAARALLGQPILPQRPATTGFLEYVPPRDE